MAWSLREYHMLLPWYYAGGRLALGHIGTAVYGNLASPARGLLVYCPYLLVVVVALAWTARRHPERYAALHEWLSVERQRDLLPGSHHDTLAWLALPESNQHRTPRLDLAKFNAFSALHRLQGRPPLLPLVGVFAVVALVSQVPGSLSAVLDALEADNDYLQAGNVFTGDLIETWIDYKRTNEVMPIQLRPHPYEFELYYDI